MIITPRTSLLVAFFLLLSSLPSLASITISGITFDSAVVNDNSHQATPADYFSTQTNRE